ncbi:MAG: amino acid racemase [Breznakibacter sp.]
MKTIGIIGGLGPEATVDYYQKLINAFKQLRHGALNYPEAVIYSVNLSHFIGLLDKKDLDAAAHYIATAINKLQQAGAEFAAISANTPHLLFDQIAQQTNLPLISIVESCKQQAEKLNLKRCGLIGTRFTMQHPFYRDAFAKANIDVVVPQQSQIERIHELLFSELELGIFREETKQELLAIVQTMIDNQAIDALILGCTEFPIMFTDTSYLGIPFLNTTQIHVDAIVTECLSNA